ncbi:hypothetical protein V9T40_013998 [Parthenolecanium corni]|uniref:Adenylate cyclase n=1 Tax=Parthenolecanium corni TaxID=536013 RepID=A0AAN9TC66_9HEMI
MRTARRASTSITAIFKPYISFEPAYALFLLSHKLSELVRTNLYLQKKCRRQMNFEPDLETPCDDERGGIDFVASVNSKSLFVANLTATALVVVLAAKCDKSKGSRKFSILLPVVLRTIQLVSMCLQSYFWKWSVWFAALNEGSCNFGIVFGVGSMVYVCSISTNEERIFRMTLLHVLDISATIISSGSSGFLLRKFGFLNTYILCTIFSSVSMIHLALFLKDTVTESQQEKRGWAKSLIEFFNPRSLIEAFELFFKKRKRNDRIVICILSLISILAWSTYLG